MRIPASKAVVTHTDEGAFTTAGAQVRNRTESAVIPRRSTTFVLQGHLWRHRVTLPIGLLARQASDLSRLSPLVDAACVETIADRNGRVLRNRTPSCRF